MKKQSKKKILVSNIFLFAILFGLISFNKEILRPEFNHLHFMSILTGSFPNFIAALIISISIGMALINKKPKYSRVIFYAIAIVVFSILAFEEIHPFWGASKHYDFIDILASGLGSLLALVCFEFIIMKSKK